MSDDLRQAPGERELGEGFEGSDDRVVDERREGSAPVDRAIDRLAELARDAEPPKLSVGETDALVAAVLARRREPARADSLPPAVRDEPLTLEERELARPDPLAETAGSDPHDPRVDRHDSHEPLTELTRRSSRPVARLATLAAAAAIVLGVIGGFVFGRRELEPRASTVEGSPSRVTLPSGDTWIATEGAELSLVEVSDSRRSFEVRSGTVLFDVAPLEPGEQFEVRAHGVRAEVRGTVFSVDADARVRVYEGAVVVEDAGSSALVTAGRMWIDGEVRARDEAPLDAEGRAAAARRLGPLAMGRETSEATIPEPTQPTIDARFVAANEAEGADPNDARPLAPTREAATREVAGAQELVGLAARAANPTPSSSPPLERVETIARERRTSNETITPAELARWIADGDAERARVEARRRGWQLLEADALRALRRFDDALTIYERLAARDGYAAFTGARVAAHELGDRARALVLLERAPTSAFDERALGLRVRLLVESGRRAEALPLAARYVARFPNGSLAEWMRALPESE